MKYLLALLSLLLYLNASEFRYIQPIAVEVAPTEENSTVTKAIEVVSTPIDSDNDGILDDKDGCPNTKSGEKVDDIGCIIKQETDEGSYEKIGLELDSDNDGILDSKDECPNTAVDFIVDNYGCPQAKTLKINFEPLKYDVSDKLIKDLEEFANFLKENPNYQIIIYGYTDNIGEEKANKVLSQKRANAVKKALEYHGIKRIRLTAIGRGELDPIADNEDEEQRAKNRRIEVELL